MSDTSHRAISKQAQPFWVFTVFALLIALEVVLIAWLFKREGDAGLAAAIGALVVIAGLIFATPLMFDLRDMEVTSKGIKWRIAELETQVKTVKDRVRELVALSMSHDGYNNLVRLNQGGFRPYFLPDDLDIGLAHELNYYKVLGYVAFDKVPDVRGVEDIPRHWRGNAPKHPTDNQTDLDLATFVRVTEAGRALILLHEEVMTERRGIVAGVQG